MNMPDRAVIEKLLLGQLSPEIAEALCRQLEDEAAFAHVAGMVMQDDTFVGGLRSASTMETKSLSPEIENLIRRFRSWESEMLHGGTVAAPSPGSSPGSTPGFAATPRVAKSSDTIDLDLGGSDPTTIGGFRILRKLGQGGMGAVYLGEDTRLKRKAALKVMRPEMARNPEASERFLREARAAAAIEHDHIVAIWQVGEDNGSPFIAMPFLQGESLEDRLKREPRSPVGAILKLGREAAMGLAAAHERGLIHRDIKPANIWIEGEPASPDAAKAFRRTKILDFGLARGNEDVQLTSTGAILGTPAFMSPEQGRGIPLDARSDLFSLGVVLYRMATGVQPFTGNTIMAMLTSLAVDVPPSPTTRNDRIPPLVSGLILKLMHKEPDHRYQSAQEVVLEIQGIVRQLSSPVAVTQPVEMPKPVVEVAKPVVAPRFEPMPSVNPFDDIDADGGTEIIPASGPLRRPAAKPVRTAQDFGEVSSPKSRKGLWLGLGGAALVLLMGFVVIKVTNKDGSVTEIKVPDDAKIEIVKGKADDGKDKLDLAKANAKEKGFVGELPPLAKFTYTPVPVGQSPFDKLDPKEIPKAERFDWQPKELVAVIGTHERRQWAPEFRGMTSPDGKWGASYGPGDRIVHLYDMKTHTEVRVFRHDLKVDQMVFSPDSLAFWASTEKGIMACPIRESKFEPVEAFAATPEFRRMGFSPDLKILLLYSPHRKAQVWDVEPGKLSLRKTLEGTGVELGFSADRKSVYWAKQKEQGQPWEIEAVSLEKDKADRSTILTFPADSGPMWNGESGPAMLVSPDGRTLAAMDKSGNSDDCTLYDLTASPPKQKTTFSWKAQVQGGMIFSPDSRTLCRSASQIHRFDVTQFPPVKLGTIETISPSTRSFSPDSKTILTGDRTFIRFFDVGGEKPKELAPLKNAPSSGSPWDNHSFSPLLAPRKGLLAVNTFRTLGDTGCRFWDLTGSEPKVWPVDNAAMIGTDSFLGHSPPLITLSPSGNEVVIHDEGYSNKRRKWTADGFEVDSKLPPFVSLRMLSTPDGLNLLPPDAENKHPHCRLWDISEPFDAARELSELDGMSVGNIAIRSDRGLLATAAHNGNGDTVLWDISGRKATKVAVLPQKYLRTEISPDGRWLVALELGLAGGWNGHVYRLDGKQPRRAAQFGDSVSGLAATFSPDAKRVYLSDLQGNLRGYELATGKVVWEAKLPGAATWMQMAPDGRHLFTHNANGTVYVLRLDDPAQPAAPTPKASLPVGRLHAFLVGVNNYENAEALGATESLKFAESDVVKLEATLLGMGVADDRVISLNTAHAKGSKLYPSAANVRKRFEEAAAGLSADDTLLVAFSGYEWQPGKSQKYVLATADLHPTDADKQFSLDDLYAIVGKSKCKRVVVLVDSCRSGESRSGALAPSEPPAGTAVIFACSGGQDAYEHAGLGGGVLTQYVVKGLRGAADADGDRDITWKELFDYVRKEVPTFAKKELKKEQLPSLFGELPSGGPKAK